MAAVRGVAPEAVSVPFPAMKHGWVTRGNPSVDEIAAAQALPLRLTADFIQTHTGGAAPGSGGGAGADRTGGQAAAVL